MIPRASVFILDPRGASRTRLTEVLRSVILHLDVEVAGVFDEGLSRIPLRHRDVIIVSSDFKVQQIRRLLEGLRQAQQTRVLVFVRGQSQKADLLAMLFLIGVSGFLLEPYSATQIEELFSLTNEIDPSRFEEVFRGQAAFNILLTEASYHLDALSEQLARGEPPHGRELRAFRRAGEMLKRVGKEQLESYTASTISVFGRAPPSRSAEIKRLQPARRRAAIHPGRHVKEQLTKRGLSETKVAELLHIEIADLKALIEERGTIDNTLAQGLSRVLGETAQFWISLQNRFNRANASAGMKKEFEDLD